LSENENKYIRSFTKVCKTVQGYKHLFTTEEMEKLQEYTELDPLSQTILARMFFRKRMWFNSPQLKDYHSDEHRITESMRTLYKSGFLENSNGALLNPNDARIFLESLTANEARAMMKSLTQLLNKYPPATHQFYTRLNGSDLTSPIVALRPYSMISNELSQCIEDTIIDFKKNNKFEREQTTQKMSKFSKANCVEVIMDKLESYQVLLIFNNIELHKK